MMTPILKDADHSMPRLRAWQVRTSRRFLWTGVSFSLLFLLATTCAFAQAAAEYGSATSGMATSMSGINLMNKVKFPDTTQEKPTVIMTQPSKNANGNPNYIWNSMKHGSVAANRKHLEQRAGKNAAKLMLRSSPTGAFVKINGNAVGKTPLLLIVPPGRYDVSMEGKRMDHAQQKIDLLPKETREFLLPLKQLYPTEVQIQLH